MRTLRRLARGVAAPVALCVPFLCLAVLATRVDFATADHARAVYDGLVARRTQGLHHVDASDAVLTTLSSSWPTLLWFRLLAAVAAGLASWVVLTQLRAARLPGLLRVGLLVSFMTTPALLFLESADVGPSLAVLLLLLAGWTYARGVRVEEAGRHGVAVAALAILALVLLAPNLTTFDGATEGNDAVMATAGDVLRAPLYVFVAVLMFLRSARTLLLYAVPLVVITASRLVGVPVPEAFAIATLVALALGAVVTALERPARLHGRPSHTPLYGFLAVGAVVQLVVNVVIPLRGDEAVVWSDEVLRQRVSVDDHADQELATRLARLPQHSILVDDTLGYSLVARSNTLTPFVVPTDARFAPAFADPGRWVDYVLVPVASAANERLKPRYGEGAPGFVTEYTSNRWQLLRRLEAPALNI